MVSFDGLKRFFNLTDPDEAPRVPGAKLDPEGGYEDEALRFIRDSFGPIAGPVEWWVQMYGMKWTGTLGGIEPQGETLDPRTWRLKLLEQTAQDRNADGSIAAGRQLGKAFQSIEELLYGAEEWEPTSDMLQWQEYARAADLTGRILETEEAGQIIGAGHLIIAVSALDKGKSATRMGGKIWKAVRTAGSAGVTSGVLEEKLFEQSTEAGCPGTLEECRQAAEEADGESEQWRSAANDVQGVDFLASGQAVVEWWRKRRRGRGKRHVVIGEGIWL